MINLCDIPVELLSLVWRDLPLKDIASLLQVCTTLNKCISTDKLLWASILERDITNRGIPLPPYGIDFTRTDGITARSWIRSALSLGKAYSSTETESLRLKRLRLDSGITWLGLIRGRWVLVASSDVRQSRLSLWDTAPPKTTPRQCAEISLPGPVLDGQIDDTMNKITIAVSVGTAFPYIGLFRVGIASGRPSIAQCGRVPGASHTRCLSGSVVGFATWDGDDTYPCLFDWEARKLCYLAESPRWHTNPDGPKNREDLNSFIHRSCWAMKLWNDVVIVVLDYEVQVFAKPIFSDQKSRTAYGKHIKSLPFLSLEYAVREAVISHQPMYSGAPLHFHDTNTDSSICVFIRYGWSVEAYTLTYSHNLSLLPPIFELHPGNYDLSNEGYVLRIVVGSSCNRLLRLCAPLSHRDADGSGSPPRLFITELQRASLCVIPEGFEVHYDVVTFQETLLLPSKGFPLTLFWPSFAFDDAQGVLVMGNTRGDLCIARYLQEDYNFRGMLDGLPELIHQGWGLNAITPQPVEMDLPLYYHFRAEIMAGTIPEDFLEEITRNWSEILLPYDAIPGWSSDWSSFKHLSNWIAPTLRWGRSDPDQVDGLCDAVLSAQYDCAPLGDVIPVLFKDDEDQDTLIFRIGKRPYVWIYQGEGVPPEYWEIMVDIDVLLRVADFYAAPRLHVKIASGDLGFHYQRRCVKSYDHIVEDIALDKLHVQLNPNPENWSAGDWKAIDVLLYPN